MEQLLEILESARQDTINLSNNMIASYNLHPGDFPVCGLNMLNQQCIILMETITQYATLWSRIERTPAITRLIYDHNNQREENAQRIVSICKSSFIASMSSIEYCAKETVSKFASQLTSEIKKDIHLSTIITESYNANIIDEDSQTLWQGLNQLRNAIVHNNGISNKNRTYIIDDTTSLIMTKGEMISSKLTFFPIIIKALTNKYNEWACAILDNSDYKPELPKPYQRLLSDTHKQLLSTLTSKYPSIKLTTIRQKSKESQQFSSLIEESLSSNGWEIEQFITFAPWEEQLPTISRHINYTNSEMFDELSQLMQSIEPQIKIGIHETTDYDIVLDLGIISCSPSQQIKDDLGESQKKLDPGLFI